MNMKKNLLYVMAMVAVFAGCSSGEGFDEKEGNNTPVEPVDNSEVEIAFGKATTVEVQQYNNTRAVLENTWNGEQIGIWGVDRSETAEWNLVSSHIFGQTDPVTATVAGGGNVTFDNGTYYSPMSSKVNYSFYSCYPVARTAVAARR